jgi:hypothetical protein
MAMADDPPVVCRVTPDGEVICEPVNPGGSTSTDPAVQKQVEVALRQAFPKSEWGPNKVELAVRIIEALGKSTLPDVPNIPRRAGEIVASVEMLLSKEPPSILLYNYSAQPADVVGAYFLNKAELVRMQRLYDTFKSPKPS